MNDLLDIYNYLGKFKIFKGKVFEFHGKEKEEADSGTCDLENEEIPRGIRVRP